MAGNSAAGGLRVAPGRGGGGVTKGELTAKREAAFTVKLSLHVWFVDEFNNIDPSTLNETRQWKHPGYKYCDVCIEHFQKHGVHPKELLRVTQDPVLCTYTLKKLTRSAPTPRNQQLVKLMRVTHTQNMQEALHQIERGELCVLKAMGVTGWGAETRPLWKHVLLQGKDLAAAERLLGRHMGMLWAKCKKQDVYKHLYPPPNACGGCASCAWCS
jgi:hypothetical protein